MLGAIIGDIIGSRFEPSGNKNPGVALFQPGSTFTDDTVCTLAVAQWLMEREANEDDNPNPGRHLRQWARAHIERGFGPGFLAWAMAEDGHEQNSWGNGAAMRVAPVAFWAESTDEAMSLAEASTHPTHLHPHSKVGAQATVWAIEHAFSHQDPQRLLADASKRWPYGDLTRRDPVLERPSHEFDITVHGTVPLAIALAARGGSFVGTMRLAVSMGGDADTLAAIAGPIAEGLYGLDEEVAAWALGNQELLYDHDIWPTIETFMGHRRVMAFYHRHGRQAPDLTGLKRFGLSEGVVLPIPKGGRGP